MSKTKQDICRVMAEQIWERLPEYQTDSLHSREVEVENIAYAIRNHTVVPEMAEFISKIASGDIEDLIERKAELAKEAKPLLAKAKGGNDED